MSKLSELDLTLKELRAAAQALLGVTNSLTALFSGGEENVQQPVAQSEPTAPVITLEQVRTTLADKSRAGKTAAVRELLQKHNAEKLSDVDPAEYAALIREAEVL